MDTELLLELHNTKFPLKVWDSSGGIETFIIPTTEQLLSIIKPFKVKKLENGKFMAIKANYATIGLTKDSALAKLWLKIYDKKRS